MNELINVKPHNYALGASNQFIHFAIPEDESVSTVSSATQNFSRGFFQESRFKSIIVEQVTLDDFVNQNDIHRIDLIKIDVEYYEFNVMEGAAQTIREHRPIILCEVFMYEILVSYKPAMKDKIDRMHSDKIEAFFKEMGYSFYLIGNTGLLRVNDLKGNPDNRNFLFSRKKSIDVFLPFEQTNSLIQQLL